MNSHRGHAAVLHQFKEADIPLPQVVIGREPLPTSADASPIASEDVRHEPFIGPIGYF